MKTGLNACSSVALLPYVYANKYTEICCNMRYHSMEISEPTKSISGVASVYTRQCSLRHQLASLQETQLSQTNRA